MKAKTNIFHSYESKKIQLILEDVSPYSLSKMWGVLILGNDF